MESSLTNIYAYQATIPLKLKGKYTTTVRTHSEYTQAIFHVIQGKATSILGRPTSEQLNLLRVGPPQINQINTDTIPPSTQKVIDNTQICL